MQDSAVVTTGTWPQGRAAGSQQSKDNIAMHSCNCVEKEVAITLRRNYLVPLTNKVRSFVSSKHRLSWLQLSIYMSSAVAHERSDQCSALCAHAECS